MDAFDDRCVRPHFLPPQPTAPLAPAIYPAAVYRCDDTQQAEALMAKELNGYIYSREGHPNGDQLAERCAAATNRRLSGSKRLSRGAVAGVAGYRSPCCSLRWR